VIGKNRKNIIARIKSASMRTMETSSETKGG
jgi:hypothetical protein